ncbi:MAG: glycosyltransferase [Saprospiraceae bacterium]
MEFIKLLKKIDIIIVFKGMELFATTIQALKRYCQLLANYNPDHPFVFHSAGSGNANITASLPHYDVHLSYSSTICEKLKNQLQTPAFCIPFGFDDQVKVPPSASKKVGNSFVFIGAWDRQRAQLLNRIEIENFKIFGNQAWKSRTVFKKSIGRFYQRCALYDQDYIAAIPAALGNINLLRPQNLMEESHNMRTFEVPGYGGVLISKFTEEQATFFEPDKEAIFWSSAEELNDKLSYYNRQPTQLNTIKKAALERSQKSGYAYRHRVEHLHQLLKQQLN